MVRVLFGDRFGVSDGRRGPNAMARKAGVAFGLPGEVKVGPMAVARTAGVAYNARRNFSRIELVDKLAKADHDRRERQMDAEDLPRDSIETVQLAGYAGAKLVEAATESPEPLGTAAAPVAEDSVVAKA